MRFRKCFKPEAGNAAIMIAADMSTAAGGHPGSDVGVIASPQRWQPT